MTRYRTVHCLIWNDDRFPFVSDDCQLLWFHILTTPMSSPFGLYKASLEGLAAEKRWDIHRYRKAFQEAIDAEFVEYDEVMQILYLPNFMKYNPPGNPNVLTGWERLFAELPRSPLSRKFLDNMEARLGEFGQGKGHAFADTFDRVWRKHSQEAIPQAKKAPVKKVAKVIAIQEQVQPPVQEQQEQQERIEEVSRFTLEATPPVKTDQAAMVRARAMSVLTYLNQIHGKKLQNSNQITTLLTQGATVEDCKLVIDWMWAIERFDSPEGYEKYCDNVTPFRPANFDRKRDRALRWHKEGRPSYEETQYRATASNGPSKVERQIAEVANGLLQEHGFGISNFPLIEGIIPCTTTNTIQIS